MDNFNEEDFDGLVKLANELRVNLVAPGKLLSLTFGCYTSILNAQNNISGSDSPIVNGIEGKFHLGIYKPIHLSKADEVLLTR
jgi:hypothetical protein